MKRMILINLLLLFVGICTAQTQNEWANRGFAYMEQDSLAQAEDCFRKAVESDIASSNNVMLLTNLGTVQRRRGKLSEAIETYTLALNYSPLAVPILMNRATAYLELGNEDKAYVDFCNLLDVDEENPSALYFRAFIYTNRREYSAARADYKRLLALQPDHESALLGLALLDQREGRLQAAELQLTTLIERHPDNPTYLQARANVLIERSLYDLALIDLEGAIALQPTDAYLYVARAELYLKMKRRTAAKADLDRAVALGLPRISLGELYKQCE